MLNRFVFVFSWSYRNNFLFWCGGHTLPASCNYTQALSCSFLSTSLTSREELCYRKWGTLGSSRSSRRRWLKGTQEMFLIWTGHIKQSYLHSARGLNSCQARRSLLLIRFSYTLSYRPGSHNGKPDALSSLLPQLTPSWPQAYWAKSLDRLSCKLGDRDHRGRLNTAWKVGFSSVSGTVDCCGSSGLRLHTGICR